MSTFREKYGRYSLYVLIAGLGVTIFVELLPFLGGLLGAVTIYVLLRRQLWLLTERRRWRPSLAATALLGEAVICFLIPITLIGWMVAVKVQSVVVDPRSILVPVKHLVGLVEERTGYELWSEANVRWLVGYIPRVGQWVVVGAADFAINLVVLLFVLYFMLIGGRRMEAYCSELMPFDRRISRNVIHEIHLIVRSNAIGIPLLAVIQGIVAYVGYLIFGAPSPLFWGVLTCFATVIPIVGTALVWIPLAVYLALTGSWASAIGLTLYGTLVVTHVDNVVRFLMQKRMAHTHPLVTIFGVIIGLSLFGFMGVIFGPLLLAMFLYFVNLFKCRYLERHGDCR